MNHNPIKLTILGGFLGSGKTTVLNTIIRNLPEGMRTAILINDFGEINIDALLVEKGEYSKQEIKGGCICCSLKIKLLENLESLINDEKPDQIYIEATGLAVPWEMQKNISRRFSPRQIMVDDVIVCTDAGQFLRFHDYLPAYSRQFEGKPFVLMTKADIHDPNLLQETKEKLIRHYPGITGFSESKDGLWLKPETQEKISKTPSKGMTSFLEQLTMLDTPKDSIQVLTFQGEMTGGLNQLNSLISDNKDKIIRLKALISIKSKWYNIQFDGNNISEKILDRQSFDLPENSILTLFCMKEFSSVLKKHFTGIISTAVKHI